jgi:hypothetical protein
MTQTGTGKKMKTKKDTIGWDGIGHERVVHGAKEYKERAERRKKQKCIKRNKEK